MRYVYPCVLTPDEGGGFVVSFPDVPGANTCGDDRAEALEMAEDALAVALAGHVHERWDIPVPSPGRARSGPGRGTAAGGGEARALSAMREQGMTKTALAERLGLSESVVRRLLNPDHRSHISQIERALRVVGRRLAVEDRVA